MTSGKGIEKGKKIMQNTIGTVCIKEECNGTEYSCACKKCEKENEN